MSPEHKAPGGNGIRKEQLLQVLGRIYDLIMLLRKTKSQMNGFLEYNEYIRRVISYSA